jgi:hypothetical protein
VSLFLLHPSIHFLWELLGAQEHADHQHPFVSSVCVCPPNTGPQESGDLMGTALA